MEFPNILIILNMMNRKLLGDKKTNEFLVEFMSRSVDAGDISKTEANQCLKVYGCKLPETCLGCLENQPNQLAHMDTGGCLYEE